MVVCLAREDMYFGALWWERKVIAAGEMAGGRVSFSDTTGHVQNQGAGLRKSSPRGVYLVHFPARQGENERRPISSAHFTLDKNGYPVVSPNDQDAPCCVVYLYLKYRAYRTLNLPHPCIHYITLYPDYSPSSHNFPSLKA